MSRKPTIKISYPEASEKALLLTEAMVKRAPGKRVAETNSEECEYTGQELFSGALACKTDTSVELTLTLNSSSMDYALETLIKPNLTADEKKRILGEEASGDNLFSPAQAAETGASTCTEQSAATRADEDKKDAIEAPPLAAAEPEKIIEVGKIKGGLLRTILFDMIEDARKGCGTSFVLDKGIAKIKAHTGGVVEIEQEEVEVGKMEAVDLRRIITDLQDDMVNHRGDHIEIAHRAFDAICEAAHMTKHDFAIDTGEDEEEPDTWLTAMLATLIHLATNSKASKKNRARDIAFDFLNREEIGTPDSAWTTCVAIEKALEEAYKIARAINKADPGQVDADDLFERLLHKMDPDEYPIEENVQLDEAEAEQDGEIKPGLLDDLDDGSDGMDPTEEVMSHDE